MDYLKPKKALGQHFLKDKNIAQKIVKSLHLDNINTLLELGPGKGILSQYLKNIDNIDFKMIEIDSEAIQYLEKNLPEVKKQIIQDDFLKINMEVFHKPIALIGNFPYNISSQIFFKVLDHRNKITEITGMVQKEVAERIASRPGNKTYGILSVLLQAYYDVQILFHVNPQVFSPPPKVKSSVIRLKRNNRDKLNCNETLFPKIVKTAFNQRRKIIRNALQTILLNLETKEEIFYKRPEQLGIEDYIELTNKIDNNNK